MKKVVHVFTVSGSIGFLEGLPKYLTESGYQLIIVSSDGTAAQNGVAKGEFIHYPIEMVRGISPIQNIKCWFALRKLLKIIKPDIVHGNTPIGGFVAMSTARSLGIRNRVFTMHGLKYPSEKGIKRFIVKSFEKITMMLSSKVFAVSKGLMDFAIKENLVERKKISILNFGSAKGVDIDFAEKIRNNGRAFYENKFDLNTDLLRIGYFGRINEDKGVLELIEATKILMKEYRNLEILICGSEEMITEEGRVSYNKFIKNSKVKYLGRVENPQEYMVCCDCVVLPTHREGFGLVNIEANAVGVPVVTTNVMGCIDSIENEKTGLFFTVGDVKELVNQIKRLLDSSELKTKMGKAGIERTKIMFNRRDVWKTLIEAYNMLTER